jgi:hypothetical protein
VTVFARGIDYAWTHPSPQAIKDAGYDFVVRYYSRDPSKNLTRAEADALAAVGLWIVGNWEHGAQDALGGYPAGVANAQLARSLATACGQPPARPIYESDDWDVTPAQEATITDYLRGWDSQIGVAQVGEYAGFYPLRVQRDAGVTSWEWQPRAWSGGQWEPRVNIRQTGTAMVGGVLVDTNEAWTQDYGQWQPGRLPDIAGADVNLTDIVTGPNGRPNGNSVGNILTDLGRLRDALWGDPTALTPYGTGSPLQEILAAAKQVPDLAAQVAAIETKLAQLAAPTVAPADLAAAVKTALLDPAVLKAIAHAGAVELHDDTPAN